MLLLIAMYRRIYHHISMLDRQKFFIAALKRAKETFLSPSYKENRYFSLAAAAARSFSWISFFILWDEHFMFACIRVRHSHAHNGDFHMQESRRFVSWIRASYDFCLFKLWNRIFFSLWIVHIMYMNFSSVESWKRWWCS